MIPRGSGAATSAGVAGRSTPFSMTWTFVGSTCSTVISWLAATDSELGTIVLEHHTERRWRDLPRRRR